MSTLHTINKSPDSKLLESCLRVIAEGDALLFFEDGVYHCASIESVNGSGKAPRLYALREDLLARGTLSNVDDRFEPIDTARWVELCCEYDKIVSWF